MHPVLVDFGKVKIYSYGLMMVLGFFAALIVVSRYAERAKLDRQDAIDMYIYSFFSGILGSRLIYILLHFDKVLSDELGIFEFQKGGLSWHGGILGATLCMIIYSKVKKMKIGQSLDLIFTAGTIGLAFGRIGCFLNGCCYGKACDLPWAVTFPYHRNPIPVHPTQLYEMILDIILFIFLLYWWNKRKFSGENALMFLSLYSVIRFIVEFFRFNIPEQMRLGLSVAQWASIVIFIISTALIISLRKKFPGLLAERIQKTEDADENEVEEQGVKTEEKASQE